jgi:hypothetical protein
MTRIAEAVFASTLLVRLTREEGIAGSATVWLWLWRFQKMRGFFASLRMTTFFRWL